METKKRNYIIALIGFLMMLLGMSMTTWAEGVIEYNLWVGGTRVTSLNEKNVLGETQPEKVRYDSAHHILTLDGADINSDATYTVGDGDRIKFGYGIRWENTDPLTINVTKDSTVFRKDGGFDSSGKPILTQSYGIVASQCEVIVTGEGKLTVYGGGDTTCNGINAKTINLQGRLTAIGGTSIPGSRSCGVVANVIKGNGELIAKGEDYGIFAGGGLTINGCTVNARGGRKGVFASDVANTATGTVTINGGTVTAIGDESGIGSHNNVTINGGAVTAIGDESGIGSYNNVTINGGTVTATGTEYGIDASNNTTIKGGTVTASGVFQGINAGSVTIGENVSVKAGDSEGSAIDITDFSNWKHSEKWVKTQKTTTPTPQPQTETPQTETSQPQTEASAPAVTEKPITILKTPAKVKAKTKKNSITVSWNKIKKTKKTKALRKQIMNIEVQYSTDPSFPKETTVSRIIGKNKTKLVLRGLQRKTMYYVRVRYVGTDGVSSWKTKHARTK